MYYDSNGVNLYNMLNGEIQGIPDTLRVNRVGSDIDFGDKTAWLWMSVKADAVKKSRG